MGFAPGRGGNAARPEPDRRLSRRCRSARSCRRRGGAALHGADARPSGVAPGERVWLPVSGCCSARVCDPQVLLSARRCCAAKARTAPNLLPSARRRCPRPVVLFSRSRAMVLLPASAATLRGAQHERRVLLGQGMRPLLLRRDGVTRCEHATVGCCARRVRRRRVGCWSAQVRGRWCCPAREVLLAAGLLFAALAVDGVGLGAMISGPTVLLPVVLFPAP